MDDDRQIIDVVGEEVSEDGTPVEQPILETHWRCDRCARPVPTYVGRCPSCRLINTLRVAQGPCPPPPVPKRKQPEGDRFADMRLAPSVDFSDRHVGSQPIGEVEQDFEPVERLLTHIPSIDNVLGRDDPGAARGSVVLVGGSPGCGKSTILLQACAAVAERGEVALFVTGEQTKMEMVQYGNRLGILSDSARHLLRVAYSTSLEEVESEIAMHGPSMLVLDSLTLFSTMRDEGRPGSMNQAIAVMRAIYDITVENKIATFVVSQVTKDGDFASSKAVQHHAHVVARMRLVDDPIERYPLASAHGDELGSDGLPLDFVELNCPEKNRFGKRRVPGYFVVGESGLLQSLDVPVPRRRRFGGGAASNQDPVF